MDGRLAGKVAIITGAASGIGAESARVFAAQGARVVVADINADGATAVAREIGDAGGQALGVAVDVRDPAQVEGMIAAGLDVFERVDIMFANAGIGLHGSVVDLKIEHFDEL